MIKLSLTERQIIYETINDLILEIYHPYDTCWLWNDWNDRTKGYTKCWKSHVIQTRQEQLALIKSLEDEEE